MEYRPHRLINLFLITSLIIFISGCGYLTNDKIETKIEITKNIYLFKQENDESVNLVYKESEQIYAEILSDCKIILYDSLSRTIYAKMFINQAMSKYHKIEIIDNDSKTISKGIRKSIISKNEFEVQLKKENKKWNFD